VGIALHESIPNRAEFEASSESHTPMVTCTEGGMLTHFLSSCILHAILLVEKSLMTCRSISKGRGG
jgi:hypothetical protein